MNNTDIKDLMSQFDQSSLREFSYTNDGIQLLFSKNEHKVEAVAPASVASPAAVVEEVGVSQIATPPAGIDGTDEGMVVESPLVGVAYLAPSPDKPVFVTIGDRVKKGQTVMIVEAMKVMNEIPAPCDGRVVEVLVTNEDVVEYGQGLVRIV